MLLGIDPKVDYAFKHLFGRDATKSLLISVIDSVLKPAPGHEIRDIELRNPFNPKESLDDKLCILDIKARDQSGRQFNVEMQMLSMHSYVKRILFYWTTLHREQLLEGDPYEGLRPTISISFLNHVLFPEVTDFHLRFRLLEQNYHFPLSEDIEFHVLELPKFTKTADQLAGDLDIWLYFLRNAEKMDAMALPLPIRQPLIVRAFEELKMLTQNDIERERYWARFKALSDHNTYVLEAREDGFKKGLEEGIEQGIEQGVRQGKLDLVQTLERLLNRSETSDEVLATRTLSELSDYANELQRCLIER